MGEAKRRRQAGNYPITRSAARIEIRDPTDHVHIPGTLMVYVLHGAGVAASVPLGDVDVVLRAGETFAKDLGKRGASREDARKELRADMPDDGAPEDGQ